MAADDEGDAADTTDGFSPQQEPIPTGPGIAANEQELAALERLQARRAIASYLGQQYGGDRDIYDVAGYDKTLSPEEYWAKYVRGDIAKTIVDAPASATWKAPPVITDDPDTEEESSPFDEAVKVLFDDYGLLRYWERVDRLAGLGEYSLLYLGLGDADEAALEDEVSGSGFRPLNTVDDPFDSGLAFVRPYSQRRVSEVSTVRDVRAPRFGLPETYSVEFDNDDADMTKGVHYSRVIHVAEDTLEDEVYGIPRLQAVYNRLDDLEKVIAGSAEMFWRTAAPRWKATTTEGTQDFADKEDLQDEIESMIHGMDLVAYLRNVDLEPIEGQEVNPEGIFDALLQLIAGETGIPKRMLTGSERGELASTQDRATFYERIGERQQKFAEPAVLRPTIDRLIEFGILPEPDDGTYEVTWPNLFELNEVEQAQVRERNAAALKNAASMGDTAEVASMPERREEFLGLPPEYGSATSLPEDELPDEDELDEEDEEIRRLLEELPGDVTLEDIMGEPAEDEGDGEGGDGPGVTL